MQFLFHEFKNSNRVRKWFYRKLSIELDELITKTTTGKLLDKLTVQSISLSHYTICKSNEILFQIRELELGDQFPNIRSLSVHNVQLDDAEQRIENLDLLLDINYIGNFSTSIDADMVLGKKGSIMLKGNGIQAGVTEFMNVNLLNLIFIISNTTVWHGTATVYSEAIHSLVPQLLR